MKFISTSLGFLLCKGALASSPKSPTRKLEKQVKDLKNGAVLLLDFTSPGFNTTTTETYAVGDPITVTGKASVGIEDPDVAYIYVIDTSGSTDEPDGTCGSVLHCVEEFFVELHNEALKVGSAELAAVISFDERAEVEVGLQDPNDGIEAAFLGLAAGGGTNCPDALTKAAELVKDPRNKAGKTHVIFAGDGSCVSDEFEDPVAVAAETEAARKKLEDTRAIVHTVAVGDAVDCGPKTVLDYDNFLSSIATNGGECHSLKDPTETDGIVGKIIGTTLQSVEMKVDDGNYDDIKNSKNSNLTQSLPAEGAIEVGFETTLSNLEPGNHTICVRVEGRDTIGGIEQLESCHSVTVEDNWSPWYTAMAVCVGLGFVGFLVYFIKAKACGGRKQQDEPTDLKLRESTGEEPTVLEYVEHA